VGSDASTLVLEDATGEGRLTPALVAGWLQQLRSDATARLVVLRGVEGAFCRGLHLELAGTGEDCGIDAFRELMAELDGQPRPVIALVDGEAMGGGVGLAAVADLVLATRDARFALPETLMGLIPATVLPYIARRIGPARTRLLALGYRPLSAGEAQQWGLVDELVDDLEAAMAAHARRLVLADTGAVAAVKALVAEHWLAPAGYAEAAAARFDRLLHSEATQARLRRFIDGHAPWSAD
jgi:enoyl-CoA hydratase/carnithine racemase